jgi:hypothetical protein
VASCCAEFARALECRHDVPLREGDGLLRCLLIVVIFALFGAVPLCARAETPAVHESGPLEPETWPADFQPLPETALSDTELLPSYEGGPPGEDQIIVESDDSDPVLDLHTECEEPSFNLWPSPRWLGLRHSSTHGRHVDKGHPFTGTSWRNRPYYIGGDVGMLWMTTEIDDDITRDTDLFGGIFAGYDWDHYWGAELSIHRATPELINREARDADRGDRLMIWSASMLYYPWGDAMIRPYWRCGLGVTELDFPNEDGERGRVELTDHFGFGTSDVETQHNVSLTFGLECRYGAHPRSYWPWNPDRHIW